MAQVISKLKKLKGFKTSRYYLQKNKGHDRHFWADFSTVPDSKRHWLRDLHLVNQHTHPCNSWSIL